MRFIVKIKVMDISLKNKLQKCIIDCWRFISLEYKNYCDIVNLGQEQVSLIFAHETTLSNVSKAQIQETELYEVDPDISLKLECSIKRECFSAEKVLEDILEDLQSSHINIMGQMDTILNTLKNSNLSTDEMVEESLTSLSTVEMLEAVDKFKRDFSDSHDGRKYSLECLHFAKNSEKLSSLWDISEISSLKDELDMMLL